MKNLIVYICFFFILSNCVNKTTYSGKILKQEELNNLNFINKENLLSKLGTPSYTDPIQNKFFYFSEKSEKKSVFKKQTKYSYVFVFTFDKDEKIISSNVYNIKELQNVKFSNEKTTNEIIKRGLLEKIFGGVGPQQELPTTP